MVLGSQVVAADLLTFGSGMAAKAADVNHNFQELSKRLDSLAKVVGEQALLHDSIKGLREKVRADSMALSAGVLLPGSVAGFLVSPDADGYLPDSDRTWIYAAGQGLVGSVKVPDLRGQFLRGIDAKFQGKLAATDPDGTRDPGGLQKGTLESHTHGVPLGTAWVASQSTPTPPSALYPVLEGKSSLKVEKYMSPTSAGGAETRPTNTAVFWYVKVK